MSDNQKYYYMRLKENFFDSDSMILLESLQDGYIYSNILLKLYLRSLKDEGRLMLNGRIPYNAQMLASITRTQVGTIEKAISIFKELGLIEILDSGAIYMLDIQDYIGKSSTEGDRKRAYRDRISKEAIKLDKCPDKCLDKCTDIRTPEIEIELDIELESELEKRDSCKKNARFTPPTIEEVHDYCMEHGYKVDAEAFVNFYESKGWMVGKNKMKKWQSAVANWARRDAEKKPAYSKPAYKPYETNSIDLSIFEE